MKILKVFLYFLGTIFILLTALIIYANISLNPTIWAIRGLFSTTTYTDHEDLETIRDEITVIKDVEYPSLYKKNTIDIIYPTNYTESLPVIYWVHGGAFVAGDKNDVTNYMIVLANEGYVIVNINYELSPKAKYPAPIIQIGEAYQFIENSINYPFINKDHIYIGGDSAGAHMAAQFILIQTNPNYLSTLKSLDQTKDIEKTIYKPIAGAILFAGPYNFHLLSNLIETRARSSHNPFLTSLVSFFASRIGQAYLGPKDWKDNEDYLTLSINDFVNSDFPKTFLTDGRKLSFEDHSKELEHALINQGVEVKSVYYDYDLMHEYQFNLGTISDDDNNYAQLTFDELINYLKS